MYDCTPYLSQLIRKSGIVASSKPGSVPSGATLPKYTIHTSGSEEKKSLITKEMEAGNKFWTPISEGGPDRSFFTGEEKALLIALYDCWFSKSEYIRFEYLGYYIRPPSEGHPESILESPRKRLWCNLLQPQSTVYFKLVGLSFPSASVRHIPGHSFYVSLFYYCRTNGVEYEFFHVQEREPPWSYW